MWQQLTEIPLQCKFNGKSLSKQDYLACWRERFYTMWQLHEKFTEELLIIQRLPEEIICFSVYACIQKQEQSKEMEMTEDNRI